MAVKYKDLEKAGLTDSIREITEYEMIHGLPEGYDTLKNYSPYNPQEVAGRGSWGVGDNAFMSDADYKTLQGYQDQWFNAQAAGDQAGMDAAHEAAQQLRYKYGYSGGADGSLYKPAVVDVSSMKDEERYGGSWGSGWTPSYGDSSFVSKYQSQIDALANSILGREAFSYNKDTDPLYQQYKDSYTRGGQRGMQDTLAQVSARTGGLASSYAQSAAQQTYNNYMAALADKVPELQQLAYSMYMDDIAMDRADLDMLMGLDSTDYGRWSDDRNFNYGAYRDSVADAQWQQNFNYQMAQDALAQQNWQTQWDYNVLQDELARQDALNKLYASSGGSAYAEAMTDLQTIYGMRNEAEVYDFLVSQNYSAAEVENYLDYWRQNRYSKENNAVPSSGKVTVPEYGTITEEEAERLVNEGALIITGADRNGDPIFALPANKKNPIKLTK